VANTAGRGQVERTYFAIFFGAKKMAVKETVAVRKLNDSSLFFWKELNLLPIVGSNSNTFLSLKHLESIC
jgi:hypothetical protein